MTIQNLIKVVPPPAQPSEAFGGPWEPVEAEIGATLPQDYKDLVRLYGSGQFIEYITIDVPRCRNPHVRLETQVRVVSSILSKNEEFIYALWPNKGGLIALGATDLWDYLFWIPTGPAETWKIVVWERDEGFEVFDCDLTDFLAGLAAGKIAPRWFPDDLLPCDEFFRPYSGLPEWGDAASD